MKSESVCESASEGGVYPLHATGLVLVRKRGCKGFCVMDGADVASVNVWRWVRLTSEGWWAGRGNQGYPRVGPCSRFSVHSFF